MENYLKAFLMCSQCTRQREEEYGNGWRCPYIHKRVQSHTDAEKCDGFLLPMGHDRMWDNQEKIMLDN